MIVKGLVVNNGIDLVFVDINVVNFDLIYNCLDMIINLCMEFEC